MAKETQESLGAVFFETVSGKQPVREFIIGLTKKDQREVGADIRSVQLGFPMGLPLVKKVATDLWEVRSSIKDGICRVFFTVIGKSMVLLHAFLKKTQKTPPKEIAIANERLKEFRKMQKQGAQAPV